MAKKRPDPKAEPTKRKRAKEADATPLRESRDYSQRALEIVREATEGHNE